MQSCGRRALRSTVAEGIPASPSTSIWDALASAHRRKLDVLQSTLEVRAWQTAADMLLWSASGDSSGHGRYLFHTSDSARKLSSAWTVTALLIELKRRLGASNSWFCSLAAVTTSRSWQPRLRARAEQWARPSETPDAPGFGSAGPP